MGVYDNPGAFLHSTLDDVVPMKVTGTSVNDLVMVDKKLYSDFIIVENGYAVVYLKLN